MTTLSDGRKAYDTTRDMIRTGLTATQAAGLITISERDALVQWCDTQHCDDEICTAARTVKKAHDAKLAEYRAAEARKAANSGPTSMAAGHTPSREERLEKLMKSMEPLRYRNVDMPTNSPDNTKGTEPEL